MAEFVLVMTLLVPLVLGIAQVGLVLHVRNTATAAASEGARSAAALDASAADGADEARRLIRESLDDRYARDVSARYVVVDGVPSAEVVVHAEVPALGLFGPSVGLTVMGHSVREVAP